MAIKHRKVNTVPDGGDTSLVRPSDWNDTHEFLVGSQRLVGNATGAPAEAQDVALVSGNGNLLVGWSAGTVTLTVTGLAAASHTHDWGDITGAPTTLAGYGITDAASSAHNHDAAYATLAEAKRARLRSFFFTGA